MFWNMPETTWLMTSGKVKRVEEHVVTEVLWH
jgi:hypothetical protein